MASRIKDRLFAPWERKFERLMTPFEAFVHEQTSSSIVLLIVTAAALLIANSPWYPIYSTFVHGEVSFEAFQWSLSKTVHHWVNDGLMALFFFVVGLEIKREFTTGELADQKRAMLPFVAAIGGMVVPALFYLLVAGDGEFARGWGIPMATDIAFAVGALVLLGDRAPKALLTFLVGLAIIDDLGATLIIAAFYTEQIDYEYLAAALAVFAALVTANRVGIRSALPYFLLGACLWAVMLKSGVHSTLAGIATALSIPSRSKYDIDLFAPRLKRLVAAYERAYDETSVAKKSQKLRAIMQTMENGIVGTRSPAYRLEHHLHLPVVFVVVPLFAFVNAGLHLQPDFVTSLLTHPVAFGICLGLVGGKSLGIFGATWLAVRFGIASLPAGVRQRHIAGAAVLGGIGFTMSMFISELAFRGQDELIELSKGGILIASLIAGICGYMILWFAGAPRRGG